MSDSLWLRFGQRTITPLKSIKSMKLKLCPFCGSQSEWRYSERDDGTGSVKCTSLDCGIKLFGFDRDMTEEQWNERVERPMETICKTCRYGVDLDNEGTQCRWGPPALAFNLATGQFHPTRPSCSDRWTRNKKLGEPENIEQPPEDED